MMNIKVSAALSLLTVSLPTAAHSQAFGVKMGMPVSAYAGRPSITGTKNVYDITVPQPNSEFEFYTAWATPQTGVCKVTGFGKDHVNDPYGASTKLAFSKLKSALQQRYGSSSDYDLLNPSSIWKEQNEWNWSIYKKDRNLASFWNVESEASLPSEISRVSLMALAIKPSAAFLKVSYEFSNFDKCNAIKDDAEASGL